MKLNNFMRDSFIAAVMADVPKKDFQEQIIKIAIKAIDDAMPAELIAAIKKNPKIKEWLNKTYVLTPDGCPAVEHYKSADRWHKTWLEEVAPKEWKILVDLGKEKMQQDNNIEELRTKIKTCAYACNTRKQLADMLPEFEQYLPKDEAKAMQQFPIVTNVVADFVKAGWPKSKKIKETNEIQTLCNR